MDSLYSSATLLSLRLLVPLSDTSVAHVASALSLQRLRMSCLLWRLLLDWVDDFGMAWSWFPKRKVVVSSSSRRTHDERQITAQPKMAMTLSPNGRKCQGQYSCHWSLELRSPVLFTSKASMPALARDYL